MPEDIQVLADRYVLEERVAEGGMATVWKARDEVLARVVAVKILNPRLARDESFLERFRREALAAARLAHPNIVSIYDTGQHPDGDEDRHFIVMEFCGGGTLEDILAEGPLETARAVGIGSSICDALEFAHRAGVVHRDVKPANVLISEHGTLKVADFGIAKAAFASGDLTTTGSILGTMTYISPEQASGAEPDARSDLYALGVVMYLALVGRPPFVGDSDVATALKHLNEEPLPLRSVKADVPRALDAAVRRALAKDPDERYGSAGEMRAALLAASGGRRDDSTTSIQKAGTSAAEKRVESHGSFVSSEGKRILPILLLVAAAIALVFGAIALSDNDERSGREPGRNEQTGRGGGGGSGTLKATATDFDPYAGDGESPDEVSLAVDGDPATAWSTSSYQDQLSLLKPGVGLIFDLGEAETVQEIEVQLGTPGATYELRAGDSLGPDEKGFELIETVRGGGASEKIPVEGTEARYWLVWITDLPGGGGGSASIAEVTFFGP
ncbi:MAG: serine/threonine protein kinase [Actinobacteria bacterium]|nr:serine/threonine protein kinase [Actinomycetota bacterium]